MNLTKKKKKITRILIITSGALGDNIVGTSYIHSILLKHFGENFQQRNDFYCTIITSYTNVSLYKNYPNSALFIIDKIPYTKKDWINIYLFIIQQSLHKKFHIIIDLKRTGILTLFKLFGTHYYSIPRSKNINTSVNQKPFTTYLQFASNDLRQPPQPYIPILEENYRDTYKILNTYYNTHETKPLILSAHTSVIGRSWDIPSFIKYIQNLHIKYPNTPIIILGSLNSKIFYQPVFKNCPYVINFIGKLDFLQIAVLFRTSKAYIGPDTGLMHMADAMQCPILGLFVTKINFQAYLPSYARYMVLCTKEVYDYKTIKYAPHSLLHSISLSSILLTYEILIKNKPTSDKSIINTRILSNIPSFN